MLFLFGCATPVFEPGSFSVKSMGSDHELTNSISHRRSGSFYKAALHWKITTAGHRMILQGCGDEVSF